MKNKDLPVGLSVAIPMFRAGRIGWLALEGLSRQIQIKTPWELLIAEECTGPVFGLKGIEPYRKALKERGCINIKYFPLARWIPLSLKWRMLAGHTNLFSSTFVFHSADCFSSPERLALSYSAMVRGADWFCSPRFCIYRISDGKVLFHDKGEDDSKRPGAMFATRTVYARQLPKEDVRSLVDSWLYKSVQRKVNKTSPPPTKWTLRRIEAGDKLWNQGFYVSGMNNITDLSHLFSNPKPPWKVRKDLPFKVSTGILKRLRGLSKEVRTWKLRPWEKENENEG